MALGFAVVGVRNAMLDKIDDACNADTPPALLRIYDGSRPATGGTATTLLAELTFSNPAFGAASSATLTASSITQDSSANATGTATWFRIVTGTANTFVMDGDVGASELNLVPTSITATQPVSVTSFVLTAGNP